MRWLIGLGIIFVGFIIFASLYLQPNDFLGCREAPVEGTECQKADAIVVVSGGNTNARTEAGIELYENGWAETLVLSGAARDKSGPSNAAAMKEFALKRGVPAAAILIDEEAETTQQNAEKVKTIFEEKGFTNVILVTSGYHQRRASLEFDKRAGDVTVRNYPLIQDGDWGWWWWLTPRGWWLAGGEMVKILIFHAGGVR